jgi:hypothetical protein
MVVSLFIVYSLSMSPGNVSPSEHVIIIDNSGRILHIY